MIQYIDPTIRPASRIRYPYIKISGFTIEERNSPSGKPLAQITIAPKWAKRYHGKRYIDINSAVRIINGLTQDRTIQKQMRADVELLSIGIIPA